MLHGHLSSFLTHQTFSLECLLVTKILFGLENNFAFIETARLVVILVLHVLSSQYIEIDKFH